MTAVDLWMRDVVGPVRLRDGFRPGEPEPEPEPDPVGTTPDMAVATWSSNREAQGGTAAMAVDGDPETAWSGTGTREDPAVLTGDFKRSVVFGEITKDWFRSELRQAFFAVEISEEDGSRTRVYDGETDGVTAGAETFEWSSITGRYLHILCFGTSEDVHNTIQEIVHVGSGDGQAHPPADPVVSAVERDGAATVTVTAGPGPAVESFELLTAPTSGGVYTPVEDSEVDNVYGQPAVFELTGLTNGVTVYRKVKLNGLVASTVSVELAITPTATPVPQPSDDVSSGITAAELTIRRARVAAGTSPYLIGRDASQGYIPHEWNRITARSAEWQDNPGCATRNVRSRTVNGVDYDVWGITRDLSYGVDTTNEHDNEPYQISANEHNRRWLAGDMQDAASEALYSPQTAATAALAAQIMDCLYAQATEPDANFNNFSRSAYDGKTVAPWYGVAGWLNTLHATFDMMVAGGFGTAAQHTTIRGWFLAAARYFQQGIARWLADVFPNHATGNYATRMDAVVSKAARNGMAFIKSNGTKQGTTEVDRRFNNRGSKAPAFCGVVGADQGIADLMDLAEEYVKAAIVATVDPDGWISEFQRGKDSLPDLGASGYGWATLADMLSIADALERVGRHGLMDWSTTKGITFLNKDTGAVIRTDHAGKPAGFPGKSLHFWATVLADITAHKREFYWSTDVSRYGNDNYRIDGRNPESGTDWKSAGHSLLTWAGYMFDDPYLSRVGVSEEPGQYDLPADPSNGRTFWYGSHGALPSSIFHWAWLQNDTVHPGRA